jgi:hypothetical protein
MDRSSLVGITIAVSVVPPKATLHDVGSTPVLMKSMDKPPEVPPIRSIFWFVNPASQWAYLELRDMMTERIAPLTAKRILFVIPNRAFSSSAMLRPFFDGLNPLRNAERGPKQSFETCDLRAQARFKHFEIMRHRSISWICTPTRLGSRSRCRNRPRRFFPWHRQPKPRSEFDSARA